MLTKKCWQEKKDEISKCSDPRNEVSTRYLIVLNIPSAMWKKRSHLLQCPLCSIVCHVILLTDMVFSMTCLESRNPTCLSFRHSKQVILDTTSVWRITWQTILHLGQWKKCDHLFHIAFVTFRTLRYLVETSFRGSLYLLNSSLLLSSMRSSRCLGNRW